MQKKIQIWNSKLQKDDRYCTVKDKCNTQNKLCLANISILSHINKSAIVLGQVKCKYVHVQRAHEF